MDDFLCGSFVKLLMESLKNLKEFQGTLLEKSLIKFPEDFFGRLPDKNPGRIFDGLSKGITE